MPKLKVARVISRNSPGTASPVFAEDAAAAMVERVSKQLRISPTLRALEPLGVQCEYTHTRTHTHKHTRKHRYVDPGGSKGMLLRRVRIDKHLRQRGEKSVVKEHQSASGSAAWVARKNGLSAGVQGGGKHFQAVEPNPFIN